MVFRAVTILSMSINHITDNDIVDHLVYSGASQYDWYRVLDWDGKDVYVEMEDGEGGIVRKSFLVSQLRDVIVSIILDPVDPCGPRIARAVVEDDFDSDDADVVLQIATLGEVVFG